MIPPRQRPAMTKVYRYALGSHLPSVVEAYVRMTIEQEVLGGDDFDLDDLSYHDTQFIRTVHYPSPEEMEPAFFSGRAQMIQVDIDKNTDRVWLIGTGMPGREERHLREQPVREGDPNAEEGAHTELLSMGGVHQDWVFSFTEVDWDEFFEAENTADGMSPGVAQAFMEYFKIRPDELPAAILASPSLGEEERRGIQAAFRRSKGASVYGRR